MAAKECSRYTHGGGKIYVCSLLGPMLMSSPTLKIEWFPCLLQISSFFVTWRLDILAVISAVVAVRISITE
jgi:hypothetical protein